MRLVILFVTLVCGAARAGNCPEHPVTEITGPQPDGLPGAQSFVYKEVQGNPLRLYVFSSMPSDAAKEKPAIVLFYGGTWTWRTVRTFQDMAIHLALRGMVAVLADYRVRCRYDSSIPDSIADAKSAIRWVRSHAKDLKIDPTRIAAGGQSAGGHLAVSAALLGSAFDDKNDDLQIDARPNALVLKSPVLDVAHEPYNSRLVKKFFGEAMASTAYEFSPLDHLNGSLPPVIILNGTADDVTPYSIAEKFCAKASSLGRRCELIAYKDGGHTFDMPWTLLSNQGAGLQGERWHVDTIRRVDHFFESLGWLLGAQATLR